MLVTAQKGIQGSKGKETALIASSSGTKKKAKGKGKTSVVKPKATVREEQGKGKCFHCQEEGHWKRNCPEFLKSLKTKEKG